MAAPVSALLRGATGCQRLTRLRPSVTRVSENVPRVSCTRTYAAAKAAPKQKKEEKEKVVKEVRRVDDKERHKPYGLTAWAPVDDVYMVRYYPKQTYDPGTAVDMLKSVQKLDHTPPDQAVCIDLRLDMKLEKKKKVDPFVSTVHLPHPFKTDINKVVVFTEDADQAELALEHGAAHAGGVELVQKILDDEIEGDFFVAVPDIIPKLLPLKNKLRKKFPKSKRGTVGVNIPKMLNLFKAGHEYLVENECYVITQVATLDMPKEKILANVQTIIQDICSHKPANFGPFITRMIMCTRTSEALHIKYEDLLPKSPESKES
ncbi:large ribosomal subunit protein uL1m isoform X2 [Denticeps clupeoides]|uniref:large ribosomal subunit protein uL1m isoform X2 n=1 Tax=Denticeps clupeoides TaxID=299321 RepID=UPI0010A44FBF|nr:39S ribosomal protein L1, mitochondrial isoform X2 [Denticeps clupeoides]